MNQSSQFWVPNFPSLTSRTLSMTSIDAFQVDSALALRSILVITLVALVTRFAVQRKSSESDTAKREHTQSALPSALLPAYTSHARLLPRPAKHAFSYPLIYLGVDIDLLESGNLDLPYRLMTYGGRPWTKVLGLRSDNYLLPGPESLRHKVHDLLGQYGIPSADIGRVWLLTMPSLCGFEGINPLSTWYVYDTHGQFLACILEVHNTFGEKHAYVLTTSSAYKEDSPRMGHQHAWVFPRSFHVSPFNSRDGYYRLDLIDPFHLGCKTTGLDFRVALRLLTPSKECKLTADLASHPTLPPIPLDQAHAAQLFRAILRWPLALLISTPRILYQAYRLHYEKRLAVFPRPEPRSEGLEGTWNPPQQDVDDSGQAVGWQSMSFTERLARQLVATWAQERVVGIGSGLEVRYRRPGSLHPDLELPPTDTESKQHPLTITTSSPKLFTHLLCSPSPEHFLTIAPEILTSVSDANSFRYFFAPSTKPISSHIDRWITWVQWRYFDWMISQSCIAPPPHLFLGREPRPMVSDITISQKFWMLMIVYLAFLGSWLEELVIRHLKARWVPGGAPERIWERALRRQYEQAQGARGKEGWEEQGSLLY